MDVAARRTVGDFARGRGRGEREGDRGPPRRTRPRDGAAEEVAAADVAARDGLGRAMANAAVGGGRRGGLPLRTRPRDRPRKTPPPWQRPRGPPRGMSLRTRPSERGRGVRVWLLPRTRSGDDRGRVAARDGRGGWSHRTDEAAGWRCVPALPRATPRGVLPSGPGEALAARRRAAQEPLRFRRCSTGATADARAPHSATVIVLATTLERQHVHCDSILSSVSVNRRLQVCDKWLQPLSRSQKFTHQILILSLEM